MKGMDIMPVRRRTLQRLYRTRSCPAGRFRKDPPPGDTEERDWCLVSSYGNKHKLPKTMIFMGREECDIEVQSSTVDKRHAVVTFDHYLRRFKIKDLSTANGTYVNEKRIPEQEYVILEEQDSVHLGHDDTLAFKMEKFDERSSTPPEEDAIFPQIEDELPPWANRDTGSQDLQSPMAECQGCIAEQRIEHTCGESNPESDTAHQDLDRSYSHDSIVSFGLGCNTWPKKRYKPKKSVEEIFAAMDEERSLHIEGLIDHPPSRVLRGTGAPMNKLPDELETVKKGTPLYGQPEWWGEEDLDLNTERLRSNGSGMDQEPGKESAELRTKVSESAEGHCNTGVTHTSDNVPKSDNSTVPISETRTPEGVTNMAFTVDFGDEKKPHLEGRSIGDFMPSRLRKSFKERQEKSSEKSVSSKSSSKEKVSHEKSSSSSSKVMGRAVSEGREVSPTHQHKLDELWNSSATPESAAAKRQRMFSKSSSSRSMDGENQESSHSKAKSSAVKSRGLASGSQSKPKSVIRARKAVSQEILASSIQYSNEKATYLIDKMFQNNSTGSVDSLRTKDTGSSGTEYDMYHEAIRYDTDRSRKTQSQDLSSSAKQEKVRSKEVPTSILKKSTEEVSPKKEEDKVSESGTYTIEEEKESKEEDEARKNIDKIFGVDQISLTTSGHFTEDLNQNLSKADKQGELTLNLQNLNLELEEIEKLEKLRARHHMADSMEAELGSAASQGCSDENPTVPVDAPKWVTQWAALTNQKSQNKSDMDLSSPGSSISDDSKSSGRATNGISRKRPGTGRKLPTIPPGAPSPTLSDKSTNKSPLSSRSDLTVNGTATILQTPPQRAVKISSHVSAKYEDTDSESISLTKYGSESERGGDMSNRGNHSSNGSVASLDTEVLLRDTQTVMAAMEERMGSKPKTSQQQVAKEQDKVNTVKEKVNGIADDNSYTQTTVKYGIDSSDSLILDDSVDFESDTSSVVALVNGDEDFVKPSYYKSPRDVLGKGKLKLTESLPSKPSVKMSGAKSRTLGHEKERKYSVEEKHSVVSDTFSEVNGDLTMRTEDVESDVGQFSRQGSKGKGTMSMTRPNRAFALRRARADGDEQLDTSRSSASNVSIASSGFRTPRGGSMTNLTKSTSNTPQKPRRPMSGILADRQPPDSSRSQASLGTQIVKKSRENLNASFSRGDGGRHSLRVTRSISIPVQQNSPSSAKTRKSEGSTSLHHSKSLRVTGVSARERSGSVTRPGQRTNSPKSAERNAWKRRKEYDPRKAVADAKSKQKDPKRKSDGIDMFNKAHGVTRSASFTNSRDLKLSSYKCDSTSSAEDYSRRSSATSDVFDDSLRRGFVPYSSRSLLSSKVSNSSADDDDFDRSVRSSSTQSTQAISNSRHYRSSTHPTHYSAFTPPPRNPLPLSVYKPAPRSRSSTRSSRAKIVLKTPSPTPTTSTTMTIHRRSVDSLRLHENALGHKRSEKSETTPRVPEAFNQSWYECGKYLWMKRVHTYQSYDTLIVSSIYQLSLKLKMQTDKTMDKLRDSEVIENGLDSPLDELENQSAVSEIPAYKSANQELAGVLKNLRKLEQHIKIMNKVLFPEDDGSPDTSREKHEYLQEIERIKSELAGFQPIETPREDAWKQAETASVESDCEELSQAEYY